MTHNRLSALMRSIMTAPKVIRASMFGSVSTLLLAAPAMAHHPFGGEAPSTIFQGLVSGVGHPVLGLDHLAFVIAVGLLAAVLRRGVTVLFAFLLAALMGTGVHLAGLDLPVPELVIATSVLLFGLLAATGKSLRTPWVVALTGLAGMFHGYAYGEAVIGAEPTPLVAYLLGFTVIQGAIAGIAYLLSQRAISTDDTTNPSAHSAGLVSVRYAGFAVVGVGLTFLGNLLV